jgi:dipeptidyl aminopeptidase/acylaminoacyl peptidase
LYVLTIGDHSVKPVTNGAWYIDDVLFIDRKKGRVFFTASGREQGRNPYYHHAYTVNIDGSGLQLLTPENANHGVSVSKDGAWFVDNISSVDQPTVSELRDGKTGKVVAELCRADVGALKGMGWMPPEVFTALGRDGVTPIYGAIWKPMHFDSLRKYPVIDQTYSGPHTYVSRGLCVFTEPFQSSFGGVRFYRGDGGWDGYGGPVEGIPQCGWPVDSTYNEVSNITMAGNLKGKLLLVHGGVDENVNPSATFKLAEALVKADKEFDMLILPSQHHGYTGKFSDYFLKKRWNYFVENLACQKAIWDFPLK